MTVLVKPLAFMKAAAGWAVGMQNFIAGVNWAFFTGDYWKAWENRNSYIMKVNSACECES